MYNLQLMQWKSTWKLAQAFSQLLQYEGSFIVNAINESLK